MAKRTQISTTTSGSITKKTDALIVKKGNTLNLGIIQTIATKITGKLDADTIDKIAILANLKLNGDERVRLSSQLNEALSYVNLIIGINTDKTGPTSQVTGLENVAREDESAPSLSQDDALRNSKSTQNGLFKVKGVLNNE